MKILLTAVLVIGLLVGVDYFILDFRVASGAWNSALNQPNDACNFDDECARKAIQSRLGQRTCPPYQCVAVSWEPNPFPLRPRSKDEGYRDIYCGNQMGDTGSCQCKKYRCEFKPVQ